MDENIQAGWRLPRSLVEAFDRAYHQAMAEGRSPGTKSDFAAAVVRLGLERVGAAGDPIAAASAHG